MDHNKRFEQNMGLVGFIYQRSFTDYSNYQDDLIQEGYLALWMCCLNFDESKGVQFSTYACVSIERRMWKYVKSQIIKHNKDISLESIIYDESKNKDIRLEDYIGTPEETHIKEMIFECLKKLEPTEREIVSKILEGYTQSEVGRRHNIAQQKVSKCLIKFKEIIMAQSLKDKTRTAIMKYTKKQAADILTLANNYAEINSKCERKIGCYIVNECGWRTVLSKGCNSDNESALKNATGKIRARNVPSANGSTLFITEAPTEINLIMLYGIKTVIYGGNILDNEIQKELSHHSIDTVYIDNWNPNENIS